MPEQPRSSNARREEQSFWLALKLAWDLGYLIAIPAVALGFGGAYLDKAYGTSPILLLAGFTLAILLSSIGVRRRLRDILPSSGSTKSPMPRTKS